jgi:hypothetical protein
MDESVETGFLNVRTTNAGSGANRFRIEKREDAHKVMEVLWAGQEIRWIVTDGGKTLVKMRLHNDMS